MSKPKKRKNAVFTDGSSYKNGVWKKTWYLIYIFGEGFATKQGYRGGPISKAHLFLTANHAKGSRAWNWNTQYQNNRIMLIPVTMRFNEGDTIAAATLLSSNPTALESWLVQHQQELLDAA